MLYIQRREHLFQYGLDLVAVYQLVSDHHSFRIERSHGKNAIAKLYRNLVDFVVCLIALPCR
jgi:hypothetical protein